MFDSKFKYTNDLVNDLISIERYKTRLEHLFLPTRIKQEMMYKAKMKKTHFSTSIEGNVLSYNQVERVISEKSKKIKIDAEREVINYWEALSYLEKCKKEKRTIDISFILELHSLIERKGNKKK